MLDPHERHVYLEALKPPDGYAFGQAIAATYSLDLTTLLSVPVALVLPHLDPGRLGPEDAVGVHQALQHVSSRLTIFCDATNVAAPPPGVLYSLLEKVVVQARAPHGGSLHAKFWLIRFDPTQPGLLPWMRLVVLSRNLTNDRSWDLSVVLDGDLAAKRKRNNPVVQLLQRLSTCAIHPMDESARVRVAQLAEDVGRTEWEIPDGFDELAFHALGIDAKPKSWSPQSSDRLVVISPFVTQPGLSKLRESTREAILISRADQMDLCDATTLNAFESTWVLADRAESEDGEDTSHDDSTNRLRGLHAKAYIAKIGWKTHVYIGSANATTTALVAGRSIELMVELSGLTSAAPGKGIEGLLATDGLGGMLVRHERPANESPPIDADEAKAEEALRNAASNLVGARLQLSFVADHDEYVPTLKAAAPVELHGITHATAWLVTADASSARPIQPLALGQPVQLANCGPASATAFIAFELFAAAAAVSKQFVLNLPTESLPADRDAHVVRLVVKNSERLIHYILSLLQGIDPILPAGLEGQHSGSSWGASRVAGAGLLEHLVRTKARHPERLEEARGILKSLLATPAGREIVPTELSKLWTTVTGEVLE